MNGSSPNTERCYTLLRHPCLLQETNCSLCKKRHTVRLHILICKKWSIQGGMIINANPKQYVNQLIEILYLPLLEQVLLITILSYIPSLSIVLESSPTNCPPSRQHVRVTKNNKSNVIEEHLMKKLVVIYWVVKPFSS